MADKKEEGAMPSSYAASLSTGIYGSYSIKAPALNKPSPKYEYRASYSSGIYGSYTIANKKINKSLDDNTSSEKIKGVTIKTKKVYTYFASISNGSFGTWLYNDASPSKQVYIVPEQKVKGMITKKNKKTETFSSRRGYGWGRREEPKEYKFEKRKREKETIKNGKKYNVKLIQEWTLPTGKPMKKYLLKMKKMAMKNKQKSNDDQLHILALIILTKA